MAPCAQVQMGFNMALSVDPTVNPFGCLDVATCFTGPDRLYDVANSYFATYNKLPNHVHYFIQASQHCYLPNRHVYTADPSGASEGGKGGQMLVEWLGQMPLRPGSNASVATRCDGTERTPPWIGARWCDARMANKEVHAPPAVAVAV